MNRTIAALERKQRELTAREYEQQGYRVVQSPTADELPSFLSGFTPDIIAYGPGENVIVEVKTRATIVHNQHLVALTTAVAAQPGWRIDLVMAALEHPPVVTLGSTLLDERESRARIAAARVQLIQENPEAALLLACSAIEVVLRRFGAEQAIDTDFAEAEDLLRDSYSLGMMSNVAHETLREALRQRDMITHGYRPSDDLGSLAAKVIDIAETLLTVDVAALAS